MERRPLKSVRSARGLTTAPERRCEPGCLPFSSTATGTSPSFSARVGLSSSSWPRRIAQELGELRDDLVEIADDPKVGEVEDRRVRVLVDRNDRPGALHPDLVLDRARDAERDVELRRDRLARL